MLHVHLRADFENTFVELRHAAPFPAGLVAALQYVKLSTRRAHARVPAVWELIESEHEVVATAHFQGVWTLDHVLFWCGDLAQEVDRCVAIFTRPPQAAGPYPLAFKFNGVPASSVAEMERMALALGTRTYALGEFDLSQPVLRASDPCYEADTWCAKTLEALPGKWLAQVLLAQTSWHRRVTRLQIHHESLGESLAMVPPSELEPLDDACGVDSGQCGFFDDAHYPRDDAQFNTQKNTFYSRCYALTGAAELPGGGTVDGHGVVTMAGEGDGAYRVGVQRNAAGEVVVVSLLYLDEPTDSPAQPEPQDF